MKSPSVSFKDTDKVDVLLNNAICSLREFMFHEGRLDGEAVGSVRNVR